MGRGGYTRRSLPNGEQLLMQTLSLSLSLSLRLTVPKSWLINFGPHPPFIHFASVFPSSYAEEQLCAVGRAVQLGDQLMSPSLCPLSSAIINKAEGVGTSVLNESESL